MWHDAQIWVQMVTLTWMIDCVQGRLVSVTINKQFAVVIFDWFYIIWCAILKKLKFSSKISEQKWELIILSKEWANLAVQSQQDDHNKKENWPELRHRHHGNSSWVSNERQARTYSERDKIERKSYGCFLFPQYFSLNQCPIVAEDSCHTHLTLLH